MEITLEKIELVKDRTGVGYKEAKDALEKTDGSVVDAIILIEETIDDSTKETEKKNVQILDTIKEAVRKGNVSKIVIKKDGDIVMNLPVNIGIIGTVLFPWAAIGGCIAALGTKCSIELVKEDGGVVNVSDKASKTFETVKDKGSVIYDEVKDKSGNLFETAKDKGGDLFEAAKGKSGDLFEAAKDKSGELFEAAKDKGGDLYEAARDKGGDLYEAAKDRFVKEKAPEAEETYAKKNDFDLSDLDLDGMEEDK
ncbi:MAG: DUF4342 domain-containing protein [Firmicutes bacterium]|nr:DUF4342 domain-containing protein [Bacillota bacterium]MBQ1579755.1 DUF4342 domain-containing protein [Bacillota bacterium]MBQ2084598.1 DUF4342 domain-containing protein [Bacillota bacterium]MBQ2146792.1 DUF4342 domain-containing protein [Bacillota bacterium]MBQ4003869.1 DUF4342 domain-containing protein [Bacillota bacterium]